MKGGRKAEGEKLIPAKAELFAIICKKIWKTLCSLLEVAVLLRHVRPTHKDFVSPQLNEPSRLYRYICDQHAFNGT